MTKKQLEPEEKTLSDAFDAGKFKSNLNDERRTLLAKSATATQKKDKRINIRLSSRDLSALQRRAAKEGLPYQTLVSSILHKYASGSLKDITSR